MLVKNFEQYREAKEKGGLIYQLDFEKTLYSQCDYIIQKKITIYKDQK